MATKNLLTAVVCVFAFTLSGCGDAGDHFGEFKETNARVVPVAKVTISVPTWNGQPGTYPVQLTAYEAHGNPVPAGESFTHPVVL